MDEVRVTEVGWWRSPRLVAAAACFLLGAAILVAGFAPGLAPAPAPASTDLPALDEFGAPPEIVAHDDGEAELVVYITGAVVAPDVYRLPPGARVKDAVTAAGGLRPDAAPEGVNLAEPVGDAQHVHVPAFADLAAPAARAEADSGLIDLNSASATELEELPGVGKVLAERIMARREEQGPYTSVEELREVTGVGPALFDKIVPLVSTDP